jgi:hypothetical protein
VLAGSAIFKLRDAHGIPLGCIFTWAGQDGVALDLVGFVKSARIAEWSEKKIQAVLDEATKDCLHPVTVWVSKWIQIVP